MVGSVDVGCFPSISYWITSETGKKKAVLGASPRTAIGSIYVTQNFVEIRNLINLGPPCASRKPPVEEKYRSLVRFCAFN